MGAEDEKKDVEMKEEEVEGEEKAEVKEEDAEMKEAKEEEQEGGEEAAEKEAKKPTEQETDAPEESRAKVGLGTVDVNVADATLNVMPTAGNKLLMPLTEGGFQYLLAGVRATAGVKSGRYMFEIKIVEMHRASDSQGNQQTRAPMPRNLVRIGLSEAGSSLLLGDGSSQSVCFDSEGFMTFESNRKKVSQKFGRGATVAMVVNMDEASPNANTVSLFKEGVRICEPQAIPEQLRGKALFPTVTYKNVTVQVNFGPRPLAPLPFRCNMLASAAQADVDVAVVAERSGGKCEVVFPVGLPEQGYFDWVDGFLEKHPEFVELSDRKILEWASKSGLPKPRSQGQSNDKPDLKLGLPQMDEASLRQILSNVAPTVCRNFIVPELKANLIAKERKAALSKFALPGFKKVAAVLMGEPSAEFKEHVQGLILAEKRSKADAEKKKKAAEEERKQAYAEKRKKAEEARKAAKKKRDGEEAEAQEEDVKEEAEEDKKEETKAEEEEAVELTEEEKAVTFRKTALPDMSDSVLVKSYADFSLPSEEEGFDEVVYHWRPESEASKMLKEWVFSRKMTQRVEDLKPGEAFKEAWAQWQKSLQEWRKLQSEWKDPTKRKALLAKRAEAKKKEAEEKGEEPKEDDPEFDVDLIDVSSVEDILDVGNGEPLFANFVYEDWFLLSTRYEIHLLLHSFKKDLNDADRPSFTEKDLSFYYNRYFRKVFSLKNYNAKELAGLVELIQDTLAVNETTSFLEPVLPGDATPVAIVKLTEEARRERQCRVDAGDETAELKLPRNNPAQNRPAAASGGGGGGGGGAGAGAGARGGAGPGGRGGAPPSARGPAGGGGGNGSSYGASRAVYGGGAGAQKRPYGGGVVGGGSSYPAAKQPRAGGYGTGAYGRR